MPKPSRPNRFGKFSLAILSVAALLLTHAASANAESTEVPISIEVYYSDPCTFDPVGAIWSPEVFVTYLTPEGDFDGSVDVFAGDNQVDISHENFFTEGTDSCGDTVSDYGTLSTIISVPGFTASVDCELEACAIATNPYTLEGTIFVPGETALGTYTGTLTVTWTPAS